jgi:hypothetical protein
LASQRLEEAARCMSHLTGWEPEATPLERRLEARIGVIRGVAKEHSLEAATRLLTAALSTAPEDLRSRLEFLSPALQFAATADDRVLLALPEREREAARLIAADLLKK